MTMEFRKVFDLIPSEFDAWRPRYCKEAFDDIIRYADLRPGKKVLEIGPGTGQATEPLLKTGCDYTGIELGEHLYEFAKKKFAAYPNCRFVNGDFCTYDFGGEQFDMIFSAATIQWIGEPAFPICNRLLKTGGCLIMIANISDDKSRNPGEMLNEKDEVYRKYWHPETSYACRIDKMKAVDYGFSQPEISDFYYDTDMTADEFVCMTMTHADHITLKEPDRTLFMEGLRNVVNRYGGVWKRHDRVNVVKTKKR